MFKFLFGKKKDIKIPSGLKSKLHLELEDNLSLREALSLFFTYRKEFYAQKMINGTVQDFNDFKSRIKEIESIEKFLLSDDVETSLLEMELINDETGKQNVVNLKKKPYTINDYLESKDFNGLIK